MGESDNSPDAVLSRQDGACLRITLNRPARHNALTWEMLEGIVTILDEADRNESIKVIIVTGNGKSFCSGFDLGAIASAAHSVSYAGPQEDSRSFKRAAAYWRRVWQAGKPVIAAIHGNCLAAGMEFAMHADFAIAADDASFGYPAVLASGLPDTHMFIYHLGPQWTRRLLLTGDTIDAATAEEIGLVLKTVPLDRLEEEALDLASRIARVPAPIARGVKAVVNQAIELMGYTALQNENWAQSAMARAAPEIREFDRIAHDEGLRAALAWRDRGEAGKGAK